LAALFAVLTASPAVAFAQRATPAPAEEPPAEEDAAIADADARRHFEAATAYYARARYADAAREFQASYELSRRPALLINVATALERDGRPEEALAVSRRYLDVAPADAPERAGEAGRVARLEAQIARTRAEAPAAEPEETPTETPEPPHSSLRDELRITAWAALVGGVILGAVSLGTGLKAHSIHGDLADACPDGACNPTYASRIERGDHLARLSTATTFVGAGLGVAGLVVWLVSRGHDEDDAPATSAGFDVGRGRAGFTLERRF
jgi:tetratricopeptide (TPR) repeat protein